MSATAGGARIPAITPPEEFRCRVGAGDIIASSAHGRMRVRAGISANRMHRGRMVEREPVIRGERIAPEVPARIDGADGTEPSDLRARHDDSSQCPPREGSLTGSGLPAYTAGDRTGKAAGGRTGRNPAMSPWGTRARRGT